MITETCDFHDTWDDQGEPAGEACGQTATHVILWLDGSQRYSLGCYLHGRRTFISNKAPQYAIVELFGPQCSGYMWDGTACLKRHVHGYHVEG